MYMANSSKQVVNAFAEIRESITALEASVSKPHTPAVRGKEGVYDCFLLLIFPSSKRNQ